jgi:hypothetical protein
MESRTSRLVPLGELVQRREVAGCRRQLLRTRASLDLALALSGRTTVGALLHVHDLTCAGNPGGSTALALSVLGVTAG